MTLDRLRDARLILFDRTSSYYDLTNALFRPAGNLPRGVLELDHIDAAKQMVLAGLGVALLPTTAVAGELRDGTLRRIDLVGSPPIERRIVGGPAARRGASLARGGRVLGAPRGIRAADYDSRVSTEILDQTARERIATSRPIAQPL